MSTNPETSLDLEDELLLKIIRKNNWVEEDKIRSALLEKQSSPDTNLISIFFSLGYLGSEQENAFSQLNFTGGIQMNPHLMDVFEQEENVAEGTQLIIPIQTPIERKTGKLKKRTTKVRKRSEKLSKRSTERLKKKPKTSKAPQDKSLEEQIEDEHASGIHLDFFEDDTSKLEYKKKKKKAKQNKKIEDETTKIRRDELEDLLEFELNPENTARKGTFSSDETMIPQELRSGDTAIEEKKTTKVKKKILIPCPKCDKKIKIVRKKSSAACLHCENELSWEEVREELKKRKLRDKKNNLKSKKEKSSKIGSKKIGSKVGSCSSKNLFAHFEIVKEIGRGGMGVVYKVFNTKDQEYYALKILNNDEEVNPERLMRFKREANAMSQLNHPNIVRVYEFGNFEGQCYFTMDLIEGESVDEWINKKKKVPERLAIEMMIKVIEAVDYAHKQDIIHRDLKPENILIDFTGEPYLMDFGLAKIQRLDESRLTQSGLAVGTPAFMSPEQAMGDLPNVDQNSDVFALGIILYNMITGKPPFIGTTPVAVMKKIISNDPVFPRQVNSRLSRGIENIVMKALEKEKANRYVDADEMGIDLRNLFKGKSIIAKAPKPRFVRFVMRHLGPFCFAFAFLLLLITFLIVYIPKILPKTSVKSNNNSTEVVEKKYNQQDLPQLKVRVKNYMEESNPEYNKAIKYWKIIKGLEGETAEYLYGMAQCYYYQGYPSTALEYLDTLVQIAPTARCLLLRGECFLKNSDYRGANYEFSEAFKAHQEKNMGEVLSEKDLYYLYVNRGNARYNIQDYERALEDWEKKAKVLETDLPATVRIDLTSRIQKARERLNK